jgi:predicted oxidoreductase
MFCSQCGIKMDETDRFCAKCGKSTASVSVQAHHTSSLANEATIEYLVVEFLRLEPLVRKLINRGVITKSLKETLTPIGYSYYILDTLDITSDSSQKTRNDASKIKHAESFSMQELAQIFRYMSADSILTSVGRRPSKKNAIDRVWNGDFINLLPKEVFDIDHIRIVYERRSKDSANSEFDFKANYFYEEATLLSGSHSKI